MSLWLTEDELVELTGYRHRSKQIETINMMGYDVTVRKYDSFPLVPRWQFEGPVRKQKRRPAYAGG